MPIMRAKLLAALALAAMTAGCVTPAEQRAIDEGRCRSFGFRPATDGFSNCLLSLDLDRSADRRAQFDRFDGFYGPPWPYYRRW